jgi:hypothetical protein
MGDLASARRALPPSLANRVLVVFVAVDPVRDTPSVLRLPTWLDQLDQRNGAAAWANRPGEPGKTDCDATRKALLAPGGQAPDQASSSDRAGASNHERTSRSEGETRDAPGVTHAVANHSPSRSGCERDHSLTSAKRQFEVGSHGEHRPPAPSGIDRGAHVQWGEPVETTLLH